MENFTSEDDLTRWLASRAPTIGDDAALLAPIGAHAVTVDSQREGVHFARDTPATVIARRLVAVNLSDLAAVGAKPYQTLCTLAAPPSFDRRGFFESLLDTCENCEMELVGGDLSTAESVECTLTAIGTKLPRAQFLRRSSAQPGHCVWLAGSVGESALGLSLLRAGARLISTSTALDFSVPKSVPKKLHSYAKRCLRQHLIPTPQLEVAHFLATRRSPIAAIDISDGLAKDLGRLATASEKGLLLDLRKIESGAWSHQFRVLSEHLGLNPQQLALAGGEDYALAFTLHRSLEKSLRSFAKAANVQLQHIGEVNESRELTLKHTGATTSSLKDYLSQTLASGSGWDHLQQ